MHQCWRKGGIGMQVPAEARYLPRGGADEVPAAIVVLVKNFGRDHVWCLASILESQSASNSSTFALERHYTRNGCDTVIVLQMHI